MRTFKVKEKMSLNVKRLFLPITFKCKCPNCNKENVVDLSDKGLYYPKVNVTFDFYLCCDNCGEGLSIPINMGISLRVEDAEIQ
jgi:transcription elongation factor Elf1